MHVVKDSYNKLSLSENEKYIHELKTCWIFDRLLHIDSDRKGDELDEKAKRDL